MTTGMMKTLCVALAVFAVCTASTGIPFWLANHHSKPILVAFTDPHGVLCEHPCLFGIHPGVTSFDYAGQILRAHPFTRKFEPNLEGDIFGQVGLRIIIDRGPGDDRVSGIELADTENPDWGSLGRVIAALGPPERILVDGSFTHSYWQAGRVEFIHTNRRTGYVSPDDLFVSVAVRAQPDLILSCAVPWQGFSSVERYYLATPWAILALAADGACS